MEEHTKIIIGSILGDGSLSPVSTTQRTSRIDISQHNSKLPYLKWLYVKLSVGMRLSSVYPKRGYNLHRFCSKSNKELGYFRELFYSKNGKKIIPTVINSILRDPISLAVWYMDDGNLDKRTKYHFNATIATYCFSFIECQRLSDVLKENFKVRSSVNKTKMRGKTYPRLYIWSESMDRFISIIRPIIHPVFKYKIGE
ncbi:hypothetical protein HY045_03115 [Candidatus Woesebacteria bacterium]|nr:hypothetical protein [Candidatus Woesebacteria bacterium]